jgi:hypothetical protein
MGWQRILFDFGQKGGRDGIFFEKAEPLGWRIESLFLLEESQYPSINPLDYTVVIL